MRSAALVGSRRMVESGTLAWVAWGVFCGPLAAGEVAKPGETARASIRKGAELFVREWMPDDPRSHGGDGLGPVYNDTSCVACHNLGATGGGGPSSKNVPILSAVEFVAVPAGPSGEVSQKTGPKPAGDESKKKAPDVEALAGIHGGFRASRSVVLHRYGTDPTYQDWRRDLFNHRQDGSNAQPTLPQQPQPLQRQTSEDRAARAIMRARAQGALSSAISLVSVRRGDFVLTLTRRNTPPLFGTGLIDAIPDSALEQAAARKDPDAPEIKGRVSRLQGGKIGKFGWKGQTPDLKEFVLTACAVELGLEVPGHSQGSTPSAPHYKATGLDLDEAETSALIAYVGSLPAPLVREASSRREANAIKAGKETFLAVGCARCHVPDLGGVDGLYSDLLLHDMGDELSDAGAYGIFVSPSHDHDRSTEPDAKKERPGPTAKEWRTPPLWGFRDSGPYLHDGRADDLEQAVAAHGGEAARSAQKFFALSPKERLKVETFLKTLTAPTGVASSGG